MNEKKEENILRIELFCIIFEIFVLCDFYLKNYYLYNYHLLFDNFIKEFCRKSSLKKCYIHLGHKPIIDIISFFFFVLIMHLFILIFLLIRFIFFRNKKYINRKSFSIHCIFCFDFFISFLELFYAVGQKNLLYWNKNAFKEFLDFQKIEGKLNELANRVSELNINYAILLICSMFHICFSAILRRAEVNKKDDQLLSPVGEGEEIHEENTNVKISLSDEPNFIKFDENSGFFTIKLLKYLFKS